MLMTRRPPWTKLGLSFSAMSSFWVWTGGRSGKPVPGPRYGIEVSPMVWVVLTIFPNSSITETWVVEPLSGVAVVSFSKGGPPREQAMGLTLPSLGMSFSTRSLAYSLEIRVSMGSSHKNRVPEVGDAIRHAQPQGLVGEQIFRGVEAIETRS